MGIRFHSFSQTQREIDYHTRSEVGLAWDIPDSGRLSLVFPRGVSRVKLGDVACFAPVVHLKPMELTSTSFALCGGEPAHHLRAVTVFAHVAILQPSPERWAEHEKENDLREGSIASFGKQKLVKFRLSKWLDDLIDRYDFETRLNHKSPGQCPFFVEKQIVNEVIRILFPSEVPTTGELLGNERSDDLSRVLAWIDANIFQEIDAASIARTMSLSLSQMNKLFQKEINCTPVAYVTDLRLEYAARFLERGELQSTDLAPMCGFSELSAFSRAFKRKFGVSPSDYKKSQDL